MLELAQKALADMGIDDTLDAVGQFEPRGHVGGFFVGGLIGSVAGDSLGNLAGDVVTVGGAMAGSAVSDAGSGLPREMLVGLSPTTVYGLATKNRLREPYGIAFQVPRKQLQVKVHQRVNVRVLELIDEASGSKIELEGNRIPLTHSKDVIEELSK
jgi:hypothetical protein